MIPVIDDRGQAIADFALRWFVGLFFLTAAGAYSVASIPVPWMASAGMVCLALGIIGYTDRIRIVPGLAVLMLFTVWTVMMTAVYAADFTGMMPAKASLPYWVFVAIRYVNILAFASALYTSYWLLSEGEGPRLIRGLVLCGVVIAVFSLYIYLAHVFNWPEPPRTREGTSGLAQATVFSGESGFYHRATGTFREPAHMAEWLILPFFLSFSMQGRERKIFVAVIGLAIVLTMSLTGIFSIVAGALMGLFLTRPFSKRTYKLLAGAVILLGLAYLLFAKVSVGLGVQSSSLAEILARRIGATFTGGLGKSNRSYIYDFVRENPFPALGIGIGNGNLLASSILGNPSVVAFLSLYIFTLYSAGYPGLLMLIVFLLQPIAKFMFGFRKYLRTPPVVLMAYIAYMVAAGVGSEELTAWFGVAAGLLTFQAQHFYKAKRMEAGYEGGLLAAIVSPVTGLKPA